MHKMESSFKSGEVVENKYSPESLKNIKPETSITTQECRDFLKQKFQKEVIEKDYPEKSGGSFRSGEVVENKYSPESFKNIKSETSITTQECRDFLKEKFQKEVIEKDYPEKSGGSYGELLRPGEGDRFEIHHMPADSASHLERNDGPAIRMEKADHRETASCGNSREARDYRSIQKDLIEQGKFKEAMQMDIDDIREKFGNKYDVGIKQMLEYVDKLELEGRLNG